MRLNLGQLLEKLRDRDPEQYVVFDFGSCHPTTCASYRGYYEDLAIGFSEEGMPPKVKDFINLLEAAVDTVFIGWKGGEYRSSTRSSVWVANPGNTGSTVIERIASECDYQTVLITEWSP